MTSATVELNAGSQKPTHRSARRDSLGKLRILIADDHDLIRRGVRALVETHSGWEVCGEACTGTEAVRMAKELCPDIVVMDVSMPDLNGIEAAKQIQKHSARIEILILSLHYYDQLICDIVETGIRGFVIKSDSDREVVAAIECLAKHRPFFTPVATEILMTHFNQGAPLRHDGPFRQRLTARQLEIIELIGAGNSNKEVASSLGVSLKTAETHRSNVMRKLGLHSIGELVRFAIRNNIIKA